MPAIVYRTIEVLSELVNDLPIGTNLAVLHLLWAILSGRLLASRGAIIPALAASGLPTEAVRRAWAGLAYGAWEIESLLAAFNQLVRREGRWQRRWVGGLRPVAVDGVAFFRPRLKDCPTQHFASPAGKALPAIPFGMLAAVGAVADQTVPVLRRVVRAPDNVSLLKAANAQLAADEFLVADPHSPCSWGKCAGFYLAQMQAAGVTRYVLRVAQNFTARRAQLSYTGRGRPPTHGRVVRPCARTYRGRRIAATPPDRTETWQQAGRTLQAQVWTNLVHATATPGAPTFSCYCITDPAHSRPLVLVSSLNGAAVAVSAAYQARWPVEQVPLVAKQLLGAQRQFVFGTASRQRLPELALLAGSLLMYLAATQPAQPTGFWDRAPRPTAGRLRRQLARVDISQDWPMLQHIRKKNAVTDHLPKGISGHRRTPSPVRASAATPYL